MALVAAASGAEDAAPRPLLRIAYTSDIGGVLEPCGCSAGQRGGLSRLATVVARLREQGTPTLVLDGGGLTGSAVQLPYFAEALAQIGYDGAVPRTEWRQVGQAAAPDMAAALAAGGLRVLSPPIDAGLVATRLDVGGEPVILLVAGDGSVICTRVVGALQPLGDVASPVVLLVGLPWDEAEALLPELEGVVDVVLGRPSRGPAYASLVPRAGRTLAPPVESGGRSVTVVDVYRSGEAGERTVRAWLEPVSPWLPPDPAVKAIVERYYTEAAPASRPAEAPKDTVDYVMRGWADAETCGTCHPKELEAWKGTAHAKAIATLAQAGRLVDECLACHSEEFRQRKAFDPVRLVPGDGVTCATCHGDGLIHSMTGRVDYIRRTMDAQDCMACHNEERQPAGFDFAASHDKIRHLPAPTGAAAE